MYNKKLISIIITGVIIIALSLGYYFGIFLPQKKTKIVEPQKQEQEQQQDQKQEVIEKEKYVPDTDVPRFEDYPTSKSFSGTPAPPNFKTNPGAKLMYTRITEDSKNGSNFAGGFTIIEYGCGTGCQLYTIVDAKSGNIISYNDIMSAFGIEYHLNSRLIIVNPPEVLFENFGNDVPDYYFTEYFYLSEDGTGLMGLPDKKERISKVPTGETVVRYGGLFRFSGSGDMRFSYYDMEKKVFLNEWNGYPWFFGPVDLKYVNYIGDHQNYIFKITGEKVNDDCGYWDGECMENISVDKIEAVLELKTEIVGDKTLDNYSKIELSTGVICNAISGATFVAEGYDATHKCSDDTWLAGQPNKEEKGWTIKRVFLSPGDGAPEDRIEKISSMSIKTVWQ